MGSTHNLMVRQKARGDGRVQIYILYLLPVVNAEVAKNGKDGYQQNQGEEVPGTTAEARARLGPVRFTNQHLTHQF